MRRLISPHFIMMLLCLAVFASPVFAATPAEKRAAIHEMEAKTMQRLYKEQPQVRDSIANAAGYAVISSGGLHAFFISAAYGSGVAHNNQSGKNTYMKMASGGVGLGIGIKDYRLVFVFHTADAFKKFVRDGLDFSGQADAAAKAGTEGGELSEAGTVVPGATIYQLTENGLALQVTLQGTKYWADAELNAGATQAPTQTAPMQPEPNYMEPSYGEPTYGDPMQTTPVQPAPVQRAPQPSPVMGGEDQ